MLASRLSRATRAATLLSRATTFTAVARFASSAAPAALFSGSAATIANSKSLKSVKLPSFEKLVAIPVRAFSVDPDSDNAFKPQKKAPAAAPTTAEEEEMAEMQRQIGEVVANNKVVLFMKGVPDAPQCGFSSRVVQILTHLNVQYEACNVLDSPVLRDGIKIFSDWPTIPQLYVNGEFVGGCDIVTSMFQSGELHELFGMKKPASE